MTSFEIHKKNFSSIKIDGPNQENRISDDPFDIEIKTIELKDEANLTFTYGATCCCSQRNVC